MTDEEKLQLYMKNASSREQNWQEIDALLDENPALEPLYIQLCGKQNARGVRKALKELDVTGFFFSPSTTK